ncbi:MAG: DUF1559 domain-containing protein [Planctomycetota bacterium]|nr:DUF1559 domain-containing protein [Planctomycetota bacterium]
MRFSLTSAIIAILVTAHVSQAQPQKSKAAPLSPQKADSSAVQSYLPEDVVGVVAMQPSRMLKSKYLQTIVDAASGQKEMDEMLAFLTKELGMNPLTIQEVAILFDRETIDRALNPMKGPAGGPAQLKNNMKQFALAMHNLHDVHNRLPDDDGLENDDKGNLSWRVYMLPYMEQAPLYNEFHLNEPWDSDHNKTLIEKMPAIFETPGVKEKGKTSVHLFTGDGAPFSGDNGPGFRDIIDGTSNTILTVLAGPDKADIWTKPGGLDFDPKDPIKALGKVEKQVLVGLMDGSVRSIAVDIDSELLKCLITHAGGEVINHAALDGESPSRVQAMPGIILRTTTPLDRKMIFSVSAGLGKSEPGKIETQDVTVFESCMVATPDDRTMLVGPEPLLRKMLAPREADGKAAGTIHKQLIASFPANDIVAVIDLEPLQDFKALVAKNTPMPGLVENLQGSMLTVDLAGTGKSLSQMEVRTANKNSALQLSAVAQSVLQMQKVQLLQIADAPESPLSPEAAETLTALYDTVKITAKDTTVSYVMPKPENMDSFVETMKPGFVSMFEAIRKSRKSAAAMARKNNMKQIGLAFHNYHDVFNHFPAENGNGERGGGQKTGLSWRVYLLPFVEEAALYNQFRMDEDWDSPHNKSLIEQMPAVFKVEGVDKPGFTSVHVLTGDDTSMGTDQGVGLRDITDGTSNTILAVAAAADTAEVWTKPGGLEFNPDDPKKVLGQLGNEFLVLMCDGYVRYLKSDIDEDTLRKLIQRNDGMHFDLESE